MNEPKKGVTYTPTKWAYRQSSFSLKYPKGADVEYLGVSRGDWQFEISHETIRTRVFYIGPGSLEFFNKFLEPKRVVLFKEVCDG